MEFQNFQKSNFDGGKFLKIWSFLNLLWDHMMSNKKFGPDRFSRFDVYWIQTDRQAKFIYIYREIHQYTGLEIIENKHHGQKYPISCTHSSCTSCTNWIVLYLLQTAEPAGWASFPKQKKKRKFSSRFVLLKTNKLSFKSQTFKNEKRNNDQICVF